MFLIFAFFRYRSRMPTSNGHVVLEKTPAYAHTEVAANRIHAFNASIKLIMIIRNPVTRLISDFTQVLSEQRYSSGCLVNDQPEFHCCFKILNTCLYIIKRLWSKATTYTVTFKTVNSYSLHSTDVSFSQILTYIMGVYGLICRTKMV